MSDQKKRQPELPFRPYQLARRKDPETSHLAALAAGKLRRSQSNLIVEIMAEAGRPLSSSEVAELSGGRLDKVQVGRRWKELCQGGSVQVAKCPDYINAVGNPEERHELLAEQSESENDS